MSNPVDSPLAGSLAADPYTSLAVHYGMLLGVSDFQVLVGNPRGKLQLHQAWQHGKGVVWGYGVVVDSGSGQLRVGPGLAVDGLGREVASSADMCLDVHEWLVDQMTNSGFTPDGGPDRYSFSAQLVLTHAACLSRPVPSVSSACGPATDAVAYSRVLEMAHLDLRPYQRTEGICAKAAGTWEPPRDDRDQSFAGLRALVRGGVLPPGLPSAPQDWVSAFRAVAAAAAAAIGPPGLVPRPSERTRLFPEDEPGEILLADLPEIVLTKADDGTWHLAAQADLSIRRTHLPTWIIEELIAEMLAGRVGRRPVPDAGGPRVTRIRLRDDHVAIEFSQNVIEGTVPQALEIRSFDRTAGRAGVERSAGRGGGRDARSARNSASAREGDLRPARATHRRPQLPARPARYRAHAAARDRRPRGRAQRRPARAAGRLGRGPAGFRRRRARRDRDAHARSGPMTVNGSSSAGSPIGATATVTLGNGGGGIAFVPASAPLIGLNYYDGRFLRADDLNLERQGQRAYAEYSNQAGGPGVVYGFDLTRQGTRLSLSAGLAVDPRGRLLYLPDAVGAEIADLIQASQPPASATAPGTAASAGRIRPLRAGQHRDGDDGGRR